MPSTVMRYLCNFIPENRFSFFKSKYTTPMMPIGKTSKTQILSGQTKNYTLSVSVLSSASVSAHLRRREGISYKVEREGKRLPSNDTEADFKRGSRSLSLLLSLGQITARFECAFVTINFLEEAANVGKQRTSKTPNDVQKLCLHILHAS